MGGEMVVCFRVMRRAVARGIIMLGFGRCTLGELVAKQVLLSFAHLAMEWQAETAQGPFSLAWCTQPRRLASLVLVDQHA